MKVNFEIEKNDFDKFLILEAVARANDERALSFLKALVINQRLISSSRKATKEEVKQYKAMFEL